MISNVEKIVNDGKKLRESGFYKLSVQNLLNDFHEEGGNIYANIMNKYDTSFMLQKVSEAKN